MAPPRGPRSRGAPGPADQVTVRRSNLSLVLRHLHAHGPRSRAQVAAGTGLTKATTSSLVAELVERGLVVEGAVQRGGGVGRPGQTVGLAGGGVVGIGVEINADYVELIALDLTGAVAARRRILADMRALPTRDLLDTVATCVDGAVAQLRREGARPVGVVVGFPGLVDRGSGSVALAPNFGWTDVPLRESLRSRLAAHDLVVEVDNDANLGVIAEHAELAGDRRPALATGHTPPGQRTPGGAGPGSGPPSGSATPGGPGAAVEDLVFLSGEVGIGGGIVIDGALVRGHAGFSGEIGHLPLNPEPVRCGCGRLGCWETQVGLTALLTSCASGPDDLLLAQDVDIDTRLREVAARAEAGEPRTSAAVEQVGTALGTGLAVVVGLLNPRRIVLGGYFGLLAHLLVPVAARVVAARVIAPDGGGVDIVAARTGYEAVSRGGAVVVLRRVLDDPTLVPPLALPSPLPLS